MAYQPFMQLYDTQISKGQRITPTGVAVVTDPVRLVGTNFGTTIDTLFWTAANNGAGSASGVANYLATLASGTANSGYGDIKSVRHARFLFAHPNLCRMAVRIPTVVVALNTRRWGAMDITAGSPPTINNGFYFELSAAGVLSINTKATGIAVISVASGSFNGEVTSYTVDANVHAYEIIYFVMGVWFFVDGVLLHKVSPTTLILNSDPDLHVYAETVNTAAGVTSGTMQVWAGSILRYGRETSRPAYAHITTATTTVLKLTSGTLDHIVMNNPTNNAITLYDNTAASGAVIAIINPGASATPFTLDYQLDFQIGLTIVTAGTPDLTVVYD
jgi:hypothetical protein